MPAPLDPSPGPSPTPLPAPLATQGPLELLALRHPQGRLGWLVLDRVAREAAVVDLHLDHAAGLPALLAQQGGLTLRYALGTHTHDDHLAGTAHAAAACHAAHGAHPLAQHPGATLPLPDGARLALGRGELLVHHAPGHTADSLVLSLPGALLSGDTLWIGRTAPTDQLGGDAGALFDTLERLVRPLPGSTLLCPGRDAGGRTHSTLEQERATNPWLRYADRARFVDARAARGSEPAPCRSEVIACNRGGALPARISAAEARARIEAGACAHVIDVRTDAELDAGWVEGSHALLLDTLLEHLDDVRAVPAPRLLLCRGGVRATRAQEALAAQGVGGLVVIEGGIEAYKTAGGRVTPRSRPAVLPTAPVAPDASASCETGA